MLFNSLTFVVFFALVVSAYWSIRFWKARKNLLVVASYIFYGAWNPPFAALLFSTTAMDFWLGSRIARAMRAIGSACSKKPKHPVFTMKIFWSYATSIAQWSHLSAGDSVEFSKRLVPHLRKALQM